MRRHDRAMNVLLIGAGIAGPALAIFLRRLGHEVTLCEARATPAAGAFLTLAPNGMYVLDQLGVKAELELAGAEMLGMKFQNARGAAIGTIDLRDSRQRYGASSITLRRSALQHALLEGARRAGALLHFGKRLAQLDERAHFEDGTQLDADLIIGCDGIRSRVRTLLFPGAPEPKFNSLLDYAGITDAGGSTLEEGWMHMVFGTRAFFGVQRHGRTLYWFHNGPGGDPAEAHRDDPTFIRDIITRTPDIQGPWPQHDILGLKQWHRGRVCLIGDAAHATTPSAGQGASLALEDAALLARCLGEGRDFAAFQALRQPRVDKLVLASRRTGNSKAPGPVGAWFRDRMMATFLKLGASAQHEALRYRADFAQP
jgi:2-polyprenyl-6-methoxyphenol hydroxylase-like FAD-dependent oxidoreductase